MPEPEKSEHAKAVGELMKEGARELSPSEASDVLAREFHKARAGVEAVGEPMLQFFEYGHLPERLQAASAPFCELARLVAAQWPRNAERTVTLRKLLEAKDAAVRSILSKS